MLSISTREDIIRHASGLAREVLCLGLFSRIIFPLAGPPSTASSNRVLTLIRAELGNAKPFPVIYAKLFFFYIVFFSKIFMLSGRQYEERRFQEVNTIEGRAEDAMEACQVAIQQCAEDPVVNLYFRLTKNMVRNSIPRRYMYLHQR